MIKLSPSILSCDFINLKESIKLLEQLKTSYLHIDVMDGMFVPNISIGMPVINSIKNFTNLTLDVHLMIEKPERFIDDFLKIGCDIINFHFEATNNHNEIIKKIKLNNKKVGMTIKPNTPETKIFKYLDKLDLVLIMSVEPGFGGQSFIENSLNKVQNINKYIKQNNINCEIEIDGGIKLNNVEKAIAAGANVIVVGSDIFNAKDKKETIKKYYEIFKKFN